MNSDTGLTTDDLETLRDIHENGVNQHVRTGNTDIPRPDVTPVECHQCEYVWNYTGKNARATCPKCRCTTRVVETMNGLSIPMCNAIRAAASDGKSYREITDLFTFIQCAKSAWLHATGECQHGEGDFSVVVSKREPGHPNQVTHKQCEKWRARYEDGESGNRIADQVGRSRSTVYRHLRGDCGHIDGDEVGDSP